MNPCCCCLSRLPGKNLKIPYIRQGTTEIFADMLEECFQIQLPISMKEWGICSECESRLRDASDFKLQVQRCQKKLSALLETPHGKEEPDDDDVIELTDDEEKSTDIMQIPAVTSATQAEPALPESAPAATELPANISYMELYETVHQCNICLSTFTQKSTLTSHMKKMHDNLAVQPRNDVCDSFEKQFTMFCSNSNNQQPPSVKRRAFRCKMCSGVFDSKKILYEHQRNVHKKKKKQHSCNVCGRIFKKKYQCTQHTRTHTGLKPFTCELCGKSFTVHSSLVIHNRIHTGNVFICDICKKQYTTKYLLQLHMRSHTGYKPYVCEICNMRFVLKSTRDNHLAVHSEMKPYSCDVCDKRFRRKDHLKHHRFQHTGHKPYSCDVCDKKFTAMKHVKRHKENIHGAKVV